MFIWLSRAELDRRFHELAEAVERGRKTQEVEWNEWYDKFRRLYARLAKRVSDQEAADAPTANDTTGREGVAPRSPGDGRQLDPERLRAWHARRGF